MSKCQNAHFVCTCSGSSSICDPVLIGPWNPGYLASLLSSCEVPELLRYLISFSGPATQSFEPITCGSPVFGWGGTTRKNRRDFSRGYGGVMLAPETENWTIFALQVHWEVLLSTKYSMAFLMKATRAFPFICLWVGAGQRNGSETRPVPHCSRRVLNRPNYPMDTTMTHSLLVPDVTLVCEAV